MTEGIRAARTAKAAVIATVVATASFSVGAASGAPLKPVLNPQWSGYAVTAKHVSYTSITGTWTEPVMSCPAGGTPALSAAWVGLGGLTTKGLEQVGVDANCDAKGQPAYFAWFEILPDVAHNVAEKVSSGDLITGSVKRIGLALVELRIVNHTRHWTFDRKITWGAADVSSAEWIVEAPYSCKRFTCQSSPLANFGAISFHDVAAVGNGRLGTLANPAWKTTQINLAPCVRTKTSPTAGATPAAPSSDGTIFGVSWVRDAGLPPPCKGRSSVTIGVVPNYTSP